MQGFFAAGALQARPPAPLIPRCGQCGLWETCQSPKMPVTGNGRLGILVVAEAPGKTEDEQNTQLVGDSGQRLRAELTALGVDLDEDCWKTNSLICRPPDNATPTNDQIAHCRPNLTRTIAELNPRVILLLGNAAVNSLIGGAWREDPGGINRWAGFTIPDQKLKAWVCPTWHPAAVMRAEEAKTPVQALWWRRHLAAAVALPGRPPPFDIADKVRCIINPAQAAAAVQDLIRRACPVSFDFETTTLKPDGPAARIVSCAVSDGDFAIAYPWHGPAITATRDLLWSPVPKIGFNAKFETRWSLKEFGKGVRNWFWDGMIDGHILDNRPSITSLAFQAYMRLGHHDYKGGMKPYLESDGPNLPNRIAEVDLGRLLKYNGEDALIEFHVALHQMAEMGVSL